MSTFLLIHGSAHGAWCWRDLVPELSARGHQAIAIDLPSHGNDPTPPEEVGLEDYVSAILSSVDTPVIAVAHSSGGVAMTQAADRVPDLFMRLVYLCAYRPEDGDSVASLRRAGPSQPLLSAISRAADGVTFSFNDQAEEKLYQDCPPEAVVHALAHLGPQPIRPQEEAVSLSGAAHGLPQSYIVCTEDRAIPPDYQRRMAQALPESHRHELALSHSPFLADPAGLADLLDDIARG